MNLSKPNQSFLGRFSMVAFLLLFVVFCNSNYSTIAHEQPHLSSYLQSYYDKSTNLYCEPVTVDSSREPLPFLSYHIHVVFWPSNNSSVTNSENLRKAYMESFGIPSGDEGNCHFPGK